MEAVVLSKPQAPFIIQEIHIWGTVYSNLLMNGMFEWRKFVLWVDCYPFSA